MVTQSVLPVYWDEHHGPQAPEAAQHAYKATELAQKPSFGVERGAVVWSQKDKNVHYHNTKITNSQIDDEHMMKFTQRLHEQNRCNHLNRHHIGSF